MDARTWDERYAEREYVWSAEPNRSVERHLAGVAPGRAVDLGAGEGRNAVWLARQGWEVTAVDFSPVGIEKGRRLATHHGVASRVAFVVADALTYEPPERVDLVLLSYLQLLLDERRNVVTRAAGWLAEGGILFVVAHDRTNPSAGYGGPPADVCYDVAETVEWLGGLVVDRAEVVRRTVETPAGERIALDTLVIARRPGAT